jgi:hypothetical protein
MAPLLMKTGTGDRAIHCLPIQASQPLQNVCRCAK